MAGLWCGHNRDLWAGLLVGRLEELWLLGDWRRGEACDLGGEYPLLDDGLSKGAAGFSEGFLYGDVHANTAPATHVVEPGTLAYNLESARQKHSPTCPVSAVKFPVGAVGTLGI